MARKTEKRINYSCDFETTTDPDDCRVWAWGWMQVGKTENFEIGTNINDFMRWVEECQGNLYFHNLRFDGEFIVNWLLHNGFDYQKKCKDPKTFDCIISSMGQWYMIDICFGYQGDKKIHTIIYDSYKKLPFTVKKIAKDFKLSVLKGDIDYKMYRPVGHQLTDQETEYLIHDMKIVAEALDIQFKQGLKKMTIGSDAFTEFKNIIGHKEYEKYFPQISKEMYYLLHPCYKGGFTWLNKRFQEVLVGEGMVFDVNSLYPSVMYDCPMPYGMPFYYEGKYEYDENYPLYIQKIKCDFKLKEGKIPTIQIKKSVFRDNEYLEDSNFEYPELYLTNVDLELFLEHYDVFNPVYVAGWKFRSHVGFFKTYIDKWTYIKQTESGAKKLLAKLMLNNLYGKFSSNPDITGKIPSLNEDGSTKLALPKDDDGNIVREFAKPKYLPIGIFITSWARNKTIRTAQSCYDRIIYCDTDSIHVTGLEIPEDIKDVVHDKKLGYWAHEGTFKKARYIRQKTYTQILTTKQIMNDKGELEEVPCPPSEATNETLSIKCAGMPDEIKNKMSFDDFQRGYTTFEGKLKPRHVKGGVVLEDTPFTIK